DGLAAHGHATVRKWPYTWARFDNGVAIPDFVRRLYHGLGPSARAFGDPFRTGTRRSFFSWLTSFTPDDVPPLLRAIYDSRPDLRGYYPDVRGRDRLAFLNWAVGTGQQEYGLNSALLASARSAAPQSPEPTPRPDPTPACEEPRRTLFRHVARRRALPL